MSAFAIWRRDCSDCPRAAMVAFCRCGGVVASFAKGCADGVDRRHVEHVKAHTGDLGQLRSYITQVAVLAGNGRGGAREKFIPCREASTFAIDPNWKLWLITGGEGKVWIALGKLVHLVAQRVFVHGGILVG